MWREIRDHEGLEEFLLPRPPARILELDKQGEKGSTEKAHKNRGKHERIQRKNGGDWENDKKATREKDSQKIRS